MSGGLLLIDGHSIIHRAFYGLPDLVNAEGRHTGAVYGFLNILFRFIDEEQPQALAVAFDVHAPTFRHKIFPEYKGKRKPMPEELREQIPLLKEVLDLMGVYRMEQPGLEADDLLGTAATIAEDRGIPATIVSGDRDLLQVATELISVAQPKTVRGQTTVTRYHASDVAREWGVSGERFIDLKALMGDTSDNIPGLPGVGEKTAMELMAQFGSGDAIFERAGEIKKKGLREKVQANREVYELSRTLSEINRRAEFPFSMEKAAIPGGDPANYFTGPARERFRQLGFKNLLARYPGESETAENASDPGTSIPGIVPVLCKTTSEADSFMREILELPDESIGISILYDQINDTRSLFGAGVACGDRTGFLLAGQAQSEMTFTAEGISFTSADTLTADGIGEMLSAFSRKKRLCLFHARDAYRLFTPGRILYEDPAEIPMIFDVAIAAYLLNPLKNDHAPEDIALTELSMTIPSRSERFGKTPYIDDPENAVRYGAQLAGVYLAAAPVLMDKLSGNGMKDLFERVEMPLTYVLYDMERIGIRVRKEELKAYGEQLSSRIAELEQMIYDAAGEVFNIQSPKQLGEILFDRMGLPGGKKTKTGYSTAADVLEKLAGSVPMVRDVLEYRGLTKLRSTYAEGLYEFIAADGRIHTTFNQTITATGRISSSDPNLQNIPMRTELGRRIRKVFVPEDGWCFADADYSQIELRILAAMSGDEALIEAYRENKDIHAITASRVFHVPFEDVTPLMRRNAKAVNFGIVYGISSFGLSQDLSISRGEAAEYIESYFATYPGVKRFLDDLVASAREKGYASTLYHRMRPIPELKSSNFMQRSFGERVAMNAPIQGTAADIMKMAMLRIWKRIRDEKLHSRMILQIHDELLIETAPGEEEIVQKILTEEMMGAADLAVPLEVDCHIGADWYEAK